MSIKGMSMTLNAQSKNPILEDFKEESVAIAAASAPWLAAIRRNSWSRFAELGIPTMRHEEWKYFNLTALTTGQYRLPKDFELVDIKALAEHLDDKDINIVFVNGEFSRKLSSTDQLPKGVEFLNIARAVVNNNGEIGTLYTKFSTNDPEPFLSLNTAMHRDGAYVRIADKAVIEKVIHIVHITTGAVKDAVVFPRTILVVGKSAQASVLESYIGLSDENYLSIPAADIHMAENSVLNYHKAQADGAKAMHIGSIRVWQQANSQLESFSLTAGSAMARNNISVESNGEGTDSIVDGLYVLSGTQVVDNHTLIDHQQPNCTSHQLYKGILNDSSHAVFNGKIFVRPIAQKTNSYQLNKHLVLGKGARVDTKPQLEIFADDVKCTHGATIGQLNEEEVFYFQTRCISQEDAVKMLSRGFVDDILDKLKNQVIRQKLSRLLARKIAILR